MQFTGVNVQVFKIPWFQFWGELSAPIGKFLHQSIKLYADNHGQH